MPAHSRAPMARPRRARPGPLCLPPRAAAGIRSRGPFLVRSPLPTAVLGSLATHAVLAAVAALAVRTLVHPIAPPRPEGVELEIVAPPPPPPPPAQPPPPPQPAALAREVTPPPPT